MQNRDIKKRNGAQILTHAATRMSNRGNVCIPLVTKCVRQKLINKGLYAIYLQLISQVCETEAY